jgi:hypothetical protein
VAGGAAAATGCTVTTGCSVSIRKCSGASGSYDSVKRSSGIIPESVNKELHYITTTLSENVYIYILLVLYIASHFRSGL